MTNDPFEAELDHTVAAAAFELDAVNCTLLPAAQFASVTVVVVKVEHVTVPTALERPEANCCSDMMSLFRSFSF